MGDVISFSKRQQAKAKRDTDLQAAVQLADGGIQMMPGADLADLLATWSSIRREIDSYRADLRAKGGTPFSDL